MNESESRQCPSEHPYLGQCLRDVGHVIDPTIGQTHVGVLPRDKNDFHEEECWPRRWMSRELVDGHDPSGTRVVRAVVGLLLRPGVLPTLVACGDPATVKKFALRGAEPTYCCNKVGEGGILDRRPQLSTTSCVTISGTQLAQLHEFGVLSWSEVESMMGAGMLRLLEEWP